ncbi:MAG: hypothetical protein F4X97_13420 [Boseongicola sp. SB0662_bin_57]|nr:hypothetical protein [Boseongicola sp. SB0662_bin_57]
MKDDAALGQLARAHGVLSSYRDVQGRERTASPDTLRALLSASPVAAESARLVRESLEALANDGRFQALGKVMNEDRGKTSLGARGDDT